MPSEKWTFGEPNLRGWCLGLPLEPLTLGHIFLLRDYGVDLQSSTDPEMFLLTVFVCSQPWRKSAVTLRRRRRLSLFLAYWGWRSAHMDMAEESVRWAAYLAENMEAPEIVLTNDAKTLASPLEFRLLSIAMADLHQTMRDAMDMPVRSLLCLWAAHAEMHGKLELWGDAQEEMWQEARRTNWDEIRHGPA